MQIKQSHHKDPYQTTSFMERIYSYFFVAQINFQTPFIQQTTRTKSLRLKNLSQKKHRLATELGSFSSWWFLNPDLNGHSQGLALDDLNEGSPPWTKLLPFHTSSQEEIKKKQPPDVFRKTPW